MVACSDEKPQENNVVKERIFKGYHIALDSVIRTPDGVLRGFEPGEKAADIISYEYKKPAESDKDYSFYEYPIDSVSAYTIAYSFVNDTLDEMEVQINSKTIDAASDIMNNLSRYYSQKYAEPLEDKGIYVFNCTDSRKQNFKISLTDNSTAETGIINMLVYREK